MASIIIPATKSLTLTNRFPNDNLNKDNITVGNEGLYTYSSFLFFDISTIPNNAEISNAELVLFKTDNFYNNKKICIYLYPLLDHFNSYTIYKDPPEINHLFKTRLHPITSKISATANLTKIVSLWFDNTVPNKGIILCNGKNNFISNFGSAICKDSYLTPFIKVIYNVKNTIIEHIEYTNCTFNFSLNLNFNCNPNPGTRQVKIIGIVAPTAIYEAVVNLVIIRGDTGHTDNYYVIDEYDNSASRTPLAIDKVYNIAVFPQKNLGDTEYVTFYGSYKGLLMHDCSLIAL